MVNKCLACIPLFFGLVILIVGVILPPFVITAADKLLTNDGKGSMFYLCETKADPFGLKYQDIEDSFSGVYKIKDLRDGKNTGSYYDYYFYSIMNPKAYLVDGADADIVEVGPFVVQYWSRSYDLMYTDEGDLEFKYTTSYIPLDGDRHYYYDGEAIWSSVTDRKTPAHIDEHTRITHFSPLYQVVLSTANEMLLMMTSAGCTTTHILNVQTVNPLVGTTTCSESQRESENADCACCMMDDFFTLYNGLASGGLNYLAGMINGEDVLKCSTLLSESGSTAGFVSALALYDQGVTILSQGETTVAGGGDLFTHSAFGAFEFKTLAVQEHSINDLAFGYPSASIGYIQSALAMGPFVQAVAAAQQIDLTALPAEVASATVNGIVQMALDGNINFPASWGYDGSQGMAEYTHKISKVCKANCDMLEPENGEYGTAPNNVLAYQCPGSAPSRMGAGANVLEGDAMYTEDQDLSEVGGNDCMPYSYTYSTKAYCQIIDSVIQGYGAASATALGYEQCTCAAPFEPDDYLDSGCCLLSGSGPGLPLVPGFGCLYKSPGFIASNYAGGNTDIFASQELQKSKNGDSNADHDVQKMCPSTAEKEEFSWIVEDGGSKTQIIYLSDTTVDALTGYPTFVLNGNRVSAASFNSMDTITDVYVADVKGNDASYTTALGITADKGKKTLMKDGTPGNKTILTYVSTVGRPTSFLQEVENTLTTLEDDYGNEVEVHRYKIDPLLLHSPANGGNPDNPKMGAGLLYDGLQDVTWGTPGYSVYLSFVHFLGGDPLLYTQASNDHVGLATSGNGIKLYNSHTYGNYESEPAPATFVSGAENPDYTIIDADFASSNEDYLRVYIDYEPSSGLAVNGHERLQGSVSPWFCNPSTDTYCVLGISLSGAHKCHSAFGKGFMESIVVPGIAAAMLGAGEVPDMQTGIAAATSTIPALLSSTSDPTFPCSAMNVYTPDYVGGKILPIYWADKRAGVEAGADMTIFAGIATINELMGTLFNAGLGVGLVLLIIGLACCAMGGTKTAASG